MYKNISFFLKLITVCFLVMTNLYAAELSIIPLKKPILDKIVEQQKITQGIIKPKPKPTKKLNNLELSKETLKPIKKEQKTTEEKI